MTTIIAKIVNVERVSTSRMGNPKYLLTLETPGGERLKYPTQTDAMFAYGCRNSEYRDEWHEYHLTRDGFTATGRARTVQVRFARKVAQD